MSPVSLMYLDFVRSSSFATRGRGGRCTWPSRALGRAIAKMHRKFAPRHPSGRPCDRLVYRSSNANVKACVRSYVSAGPCQVQQRSADNLTGRHPSPFSFSEIQVFPSWRTFHSGGASDALGACICHRAGSRASRPRIQTTYLRCMLDISGTPCKEASALPPRPVV